ncbi:MAG: quinone oxidoreductase family protein [Mycobacteriaceae bacterium]
MTKHVVATAYGGAEVLSLVDEQLAEPGVGEVLLDVRAAGVNPADVKRYSGAWGTDKGKLPMRLGFEVAGVVSAVGPEAVSPTGPVLVGDEVIAFRVSGGYAEQLVVAAADLVPRPTEVSWEQAAGLMLAGVTAMHAVTATAVRTGDTVLVHGAAGGVGLMAVQIAKSRGAHVIGTAGAGRHQSLRDWGVQPVEYGPGLADRVRELAADGVDAAIDTVGTDEAIDVSLELVADRQRIATIAAFARAEQDGFKALGGSGPGADPGTELRNAARLELVSLVEEGQIEVLIDEVFPLAEVAAAHRKILRGHTHGKTILVP